MRPPAIVAIALTVQNAALFAICVALKPVNEFVGVVYVLWMTIPTLTAAVGSVNSRRTAVAAVSASIASVACWDYLLLVKGLFWDQSVDRAELAVAYPVGGVIIGVVWAGFVQVIVDAVDLSATRGETSRTTAGMKKGAVFGGICSLVVAMLFFLIGGPTSDGRGPEVEALRQETDRHVAVVSLALLILGTVACTLLGALIGRIYRLKPSFNIDHETPRFVQKANQSSG